MKIVATILASMASARIMFNLDKNAEMTGGPFFHPNKNVDNDRFLLLGDTDRQNSYSGCCKQLIVHDIFNGQRIFEKSPYEETWIDRQGDAIFFNTQFQIWQLVPQSAKSSFGSAFSAPSEAGCPNEHAWTVSYQNRWSTTVNYVQCLNDFKDHDAVIYDLSERVCEIMKKEVPKLTQIKMNSLCQRALSIADRVIKHRACAAKSISRAASNVVLSLKTAREWRDKLMEINAARNEDCENNEDLDGTIVRFYESIRRKIIKANRQK
ncbi:unnamed protein product [Oikopleura dioica]|uniref:Uncharacterized protein n=1 Tax=Oikopleura dioica TaxID=34765 RepID=E4YTL3_OIKDI|nr:unnamed protein product [Oikopleura dioica]